MPPEPAPAQKHTRRPVVIGVFGIPGSGKTHLLREVTRELKYNGFAHYELRNAVAAVSPGGINTFRSMPNHEQTRRREMAIRSIQADSAKNWTTALVAAYYMFWPERKPSGLIALTDADLQIYTHILYLDTPSQTISERRRNTREARGRLTSVAHLTRWKEAEKEALRRLCREHGILFLVLAPHLIAKQKVTTLLRDLQVHNEYYNTFLALAQVDKILSNIKGPLDTVLLFDSDKTLAPQDSSDLFWGLVSDRNRQTRQQSPLGELFGSSLGHSYLAFRQAMLLYEEALNDTKFNALCSEAGKGMTMYSDFRTLLQQVSDKQHIKVIVVTSGLRQVWANVLKNEGLSDTVDLIGGGRLADRFVVTAKVKQAIVKRVHEARNARVWAFGDSPLGLEMLQCADEAIVVTGAQHTRSKSMDDQLTQALEHGNFHPRQIVLPSSELPRLDATRLPVTRLSDQNLVKSMTAHHVRIVHATDRPAAKLLMTPRRGPTASLVSGFGGIHSNIGQYLATEFLTEIIGLEEISPSDQANGTGGHQLLHEKDTLIVALTQHGEPMALGVKEVFPLASLMHVTSASDIQAMHLQGRVTVVLVDSVVNTGQTISQFIRRIRVISRAVRIVVVAGVVYEPTILTGPIMQLLNRDSRITFVTLRLSKKPLIHQ